MKRLAFAIIRLYCSDCGHIIWFWQERCRNCHTTCMHRRLRSLWESNQAMTPLVDIKPFTCIACGRTA